MEELNSFIKKTKESEPLRFALRDIASGDWVNLDAFAAVVKSHGFHMFPHEDVAWWGAITEELKWQPIAPVHEEPIYRFLWMLKRDDELHDQVLHADSLADAVVQLARRAGYHIEPEDLIQLPCEDNQRRFSTEEAADHFLTEKNLARVSEQRPSFHDTHDVTW